ncbi:MAG: galactosyldiacylglycerol synthase [Burkholderiales bacterium]|nr:MAG: galactosyldiacylglycerol synthase [Burkholderiales bacterium]
MQTIDLVYFDAGGGHRAAAQALRGVIAAQRRPWNVRLVQLMHVLDPTDAFRRVSGMAPEDVYNRQLARGWTFGVGSELRVLQAMIRIGHPALVRSLRAHWSASQPDLVVSLVPNFNRAMHEALRAARPGVPFVTVMTDFADVPPHFWIEPGQDQHLVCGTARAVTQALEAGYDADRVHPTSGMILRREFYQGEPVDRATAQRSLGLDPTRPTGVVMFGGHGSTQMIRVAEALTDVQLLCLCGHNDTLVDALRTMRRAAPLAAVGFTTEVPRLLRSADFFIGKPGPGSLSEALHCGLPVVTFRNTWTMPQERYNARWIQEHDLGRVVASTRALGPAVRSLLGELDAVRARVARIENRAVFEVVDLLAGLLQEVPQAAAPGRRLRALAA